MRTKPITLCTVLTLAWLALPDAASRGEKTERPEGDRPNIVFILADDLGWGDLSCYGNRQFRTPNLDRLAAEGTLFTQYYQAGSVCSPTRASLMTGKYPAELRIHGHLATPEQNAGRDMPNYLDPAIPTLPRLLRQAGYKTIHVGKWHLGRPEGTSASLSPYGFDAARWIDCREEGRDLWSLAERPRASRELIDAAIAEIESHQSEPFYCQIWLNDPHASLAPSEEQMTPYRRRTPEGFTSPFMVYAATVVEMDRQVGRLLERLKELGLEDRTIVIFSSDNGPEDIDIGNAAWSAYGSAGPLRGRKRSLYEGGIRVPLIVRGPNIPAGRVDDRSVICSVDFLPTICELAGGEIPPEIREGVRGQSMAAAWYGEETPRSQPLFWEWRFRIFNHIWNRSPMLAVREENWKLLLNPDRSRVELYDIPRDPSEHNNLADRYPEVVARLAEKAIAWQKTLPPGIVEASAGKNDYPWPGR